jgi:thiamine-monophosphate kinase
MKEQEFIKIIKEQTKSNFLGDDCAFLKEFGLVITQDNFVENVHFKREWTTPYLIGYKASAVNISDILASGAKPEYISVGLSIPNVDDDFIKELYRGIHAGSYGAKLTGGDITRAESILISITAIGKTAGRKISSRKNAKAGFMVIAGAGKPWGESSKGLSDLMNGVKDSSYIKTHLEPKLDINFSKNIAEHITKDYAMMDTSDGLADALFQIANSSNVTIKTNYIDGMFGAEDYRLVAAVPKDFLREINNYEIIGEVVEFENAPLIIDNKKYKTYDELNLYNHFGE